MAKTDFSHVRLGVPIEIFADRFDYTTPTEPVARLARLGAPAKRLARFESSAHMMYGEEPGRVLVHLVEDVRPYAVRAGDAAPGS
ncbi:MAG TPA: hypothetical protein VG227_01945 [Caulobacteraceae bacterium]|nr:hypothetical protein [Caulobacteraceae bacterium]